MSLLRIAIIVVGGVALYATGKRNGVNVGYHIGRADMKAGKEYRSADELKELADDTPVTWQLRDAI